MKFRWNKWRSPAALIRTWRVFCLSLILGLGAAAIDFSVSIHQVVEDVNASRASGLASVRAYRQTIPELGETAERETLVNELDRQSAHVETLLRLEPVSNELLRDVIQLLVGFFVMLILFFWLGDNSLRNMRRQIERENPTPGVRSPDAREQA